MATLLFVGWLMVPRIGPQSVAIGNVADRLLHTHISGTFSFVYVSVPLYDFEDLPAAVGT
jgi:lipoprotein signal peptidase